MVRLLPLETLATGIGTPVFLGVIVATTTKNNNDTSVPFTNAVEAMKGKTLLIQSDAACYILPGILNTATVTTANGVYLAPNDRVCINMGSSYGWLAALAASGTANVRVWELV